MAHLYKRVSIGHLESTIGKRHFQGIRSLFQVCRQRLTVLLSEKYVNPRGILYETNSKLYWCGVMGIVDMVLIESRKCLAKNMLRTSWLKYSKFVKMVIQNPHTIF